MRIHDEAPVEDVNIFCVLLFCFIPSIREDMLTVLDLARRSEVSGVRPERISQHERGSHVFVSWAYGAESFGLQKQVAKRLKDSDLLQRVCYLG